MSEIDATRYEDEQAVLDKLFYEWSWQIADKDTGWRVAPFQDLIHGTPCFMIVDFAEFVEAELPLRNY